MLEDLLTCVRCLAQSGSVSSPRTRGPRCPQGRALPLWGTMEVSSRRALGWCYVMGAGGGGGSGPEGPPEHCSGVHDGVRPQQDPPSAFWEPPCFVLAAESSGGFPSSHVPWSQLCWCSPGESRPPSCPCCSPVSGGCGHCGPFFQQEGETQGAHCSVRGLWPFPSVS